MTRALYLDLARSLEAGEFLVSLKGLIARRGRPCTIYSDNGSTFIGAVPWSKQVQNDEKLNDFLARHQITWKFNLSRAPWWGGQFEHMIGLAKTAMRKTISNAYLTFDELKEVFGCRNSLDEQNTSENARMRFGTAGRKGTFVGCENVTP